MAPGSSLPVLECSISKQILSVVSVHLSSSPWLVPGQLLQKLRRHALRAVERLEAWISLKASKSICILRPVSLCHVFSPIDSWPLGEDFHLSSSPEINLSLELFLTTKEDLGLSPNKLAKVGGTEKEEERNSWSQVRNKNWCESSK